MTATTQSDRDHVLVFTLAGQRYGLGLAAVERVIRAVAVTPVPDAPASVLGLINLGGTLLPVLSLRRCLGLPDRPIRPEDQFVLARTPTLVMALVVDETQGLIAPAVEQTAVADEVLPGLGRRVRGLVKIDGDIILIYDLEKLFSRDEHDRILEVKAAAAE